MTARFVYGHGAESLIFVTGTSEKLSKIFVSRQKNQSQLWILGKARKIDVWCPVLRSKPQWWIPELRFGYPPLRNFPKYLWEKLRIFLESLGGSQRQLCIKTRPLANFYWTKMVENPSGHGRPRQKSWMSAPKCVFLQPR